MRRTTKKGQLGGRTLGTRFKLKQLVEGGKAGEVYAATDLAGGAVTVAAFRAGPLASGERLKRLANDVQSLGAVDHPCLGKLIAQHLQPEARQKNDCPHLVFAEQDGVTLADHVDETGPLAPGQAAFILLQVLDALQALHTANLCHGGLAPDRVRVRPEHSLHDDYARVHLPVAGGAMLSAAMDLLEDGKPMTSAEAARLPYAAPEALLEEPPAPAADIYASGALLYRCLSGQAPMPAGVDASDPAALRDELLFDGPPPVSSVQPDLPDDLVQLVTRCLAKDASQRPASIDELREILSSHAPPPAVMDCGKKEQPTEPPIKPVLTPVSFSLGDAQREAALSRQKPEPVPAPQPAADLDLTGFNTIAMSSPPEMTDPEPPRPADPPPEAPAPEPDPDDMPTIAFSKAPRRTRPLPAQPDTEPPPSPDDFPTIATPSPFQHTKDAAPESPAPPRQEELPQPDLQPAGQQTEDFSTVLLSVDELAEDRGDELEPDLDPDDAMFHSVELSVEDLKELHVDKEKE